MPGPTFLCIGQQKAASQWLYDQLRAHDAFWLPPLKELHFFDRGFNFKRGRREAGKMMQRLAAGRAVDPRDIRFYRHAFFSPHSARQEVQARALRRARREAREQGADPAGAVYRPAAGDLAWYRGLFSPAQDRISGEITPAYSTLDTETIQCVHEAFPQLRLILLIRHPADRLWSLLRMRALLGQHPNSDSPVPQIEQFMRTDPAVMGRSFASVTWRKWSAVFGPERIGVFRFDDVVRDPAGTRAAVLKFLLPDGDTGAFHRAASHNAKRASAGGRDIPPALRATFNDYFADEIAACRQLFGTPWEPLS